jgi:hypothetical protein
MSCRLQLKNTALKHLNVPNWPRGPTTPKASACWNKQLGSGLRSPKVLKSTVLRAIGRRSPGHDGGFGLRPYRPFNSPAKDQR